MQNSCIPLTKTIIHTSDGQPEVGSPYIRVLAIINIIAKNAIMQNITKVIIKIILYLLVIII